MREHGTYACYAWGPESGCVRGRGCRCEPCTTAAREQNRRRRKATAPAYVGASRARSHVADLQAAGMGWRAIATASGVSNGSMSKLIYGGPGNRPPSRRIRRETEDAILAVTPSDAPAGTYVDGTAYTADVAELWHRGWTYSAIARAIGVERSNFDVSPANVTAGKARAVHALLDLLPPEPPTRTGHNSDAWVRRDTWLASREDQRRRDPLPVIRLADIDQPWRARSACRFVDTADVHIFWPGRGDAETLAAARKVCASCPVAADCLEFALANNEAGVWGGRSEAERREMRARRMPVTPWRPERAA